MAGAPKAPKYTAADWPERGEVSPSGFCTVCRSHFCPHVRPALYGKAAP